MEFTPKSQILFNPLPAVVIGGPPHSGKSVLAYSLTRALREMDVQHYLLRAYPPDYEGDWFHEGESNQVRRLQLKGSRNQAWLPLLRRDIARRHLPLLLDMGGLPTGEQEEMLDDCTHTILLTPDSQSRAEWADRFARHGLVLLADYRSDLHAENVLEQESPLLVGTLTGLERGRQAAGRPFQALAARLRELFAVGDLRQRHLEMAPVELVVDVERMARQLKCDPLNWRPSDLPAVLGYLPAGEPLALYGRGPNWLYAAAAVHALPAFFFLFDVRLGWVRAPAITEGVPASDNPLAAHLRRTTVASLIEFTLRDAYLDITEADELRLPPCPGEGIILSGRLPLWMWAGLTRACAAPDWVAVHQPQTGGAVVVHSASAPPAGTVLSLDT